MRNLVVKTIYVASTLLLTSVASLGRTESTLFDTMDLTGESGILFWNTEQKIYGFPRLAELYPTRAIGGHQTPLQLPQKLSSLDHFTYDLGGQTYTVDSHMRSQRTAGLLVIHNGEIKVERYGLQHHADAPWVSFSVTKSVVSMLFG
ncbi:MAG TPA: hypothetical protein DEF77_08010, partial [Gammaproteobacteria bacterium]|nr:hypothetical protein [Gammaproteobacteria bacterium]